MQKRQKLRGRVYRAMMAEMRTFASLPILLLAACGAVGGVGAGALARAPETDVLFIGTHFATPTAGYVKSRSEGGWWLDVEGVPLA